MYKHFKILTISILTFSLASSANSMISPNCHIKQIEYNPYSSDEKFPKKEDMFQFMKVKELDLKNDNVKRCFNYLQEYDPQNCLLLDNLLEGIIFNCRNNKC